MRLRFTFALGVLPALLAGSAAPQEKKDAEPALLGKLAPDFALPDSQGAGRSLKEFRGRKQVALVFFPALFRAGG